MITMLRSIVQQCGKSTQRRIPSIQRFICGQQQKQQQQQQQQQQQYSTVTELMKNVQYQGLAVTTTVTVTTTKRTATTFITSTTSTAARVPQHQHNEDDNDASSPPTPTVFDKLVNLIFVDESGARRNVSGYVGKTIWETCVMHNLDIGAASVGGKEEIKRTDEWIERTFGEGNCSGYAMVIISGNGANTAERMTYWEECMISDYWDLEEIFQGSRLATNVTITPEMDGMIVYVPERKDDQIP